MSLPRPTECVLTHISPIDTGTSGHSLFSQQKDSQRLLQMFSGLCLSQMVATTPSAREEEILCTAE